MCHKHLQMSSLWHWRVGHTVAWRGSSVCERVYVVNVCLSLLSEAPALSPGLAMSDGQDVAEGLSGPSGPSGPSGLGSGQSEGPGHPAGARKPCSPGSELALACVTFPGFHVTRGRFPSCQGEGHILPLAHISFDIQPASLSPSENPLSCGDDCLKESAYQL